MVVFLQHYDTQKSKQNVEFKKFKTMKHVFLILCLLFLWSKSGMSQQHESRNANHCLKVGVGFDF